MRIIVQEAMRVARQLHAAQVRKYTGEPYFNHLTAVAETVAYHIKMLHQAKLIEAVETGDIDRYDYTARSLTWEGREFLDKIRKDTVWNGVKKTIKDKGLYLSVESIKIARAKSKSP